MADMVEAEGNIGVVLEVVLFCNVIHSIICIVEDFLATVTFVGNT